MYGNWTLLISVFFYNDLSVFKFRTFQIFLENESVIHATTFSRLFHFLSLKLFLWALWETLAEFFQESMENPVELFSSIFCSSVATNHWHIWVWLHFSFQTGRQIRINKLPNRARQNLLRTTDFEIIFKVGTFKGSF